LTFFLWCKVQTNCDALTINYAENDIKFKEALVIMKQGYQLWRNWWCKG